MFSKTATKCKKIQTNHSEQGDKLPFSRLISEDNYKKLVKFQKKPSKRYKSSIYLVMEYVIRQKMS